MFQRRHFVFIADMLREMHADSTMVDICVRSLKSVAPNFNEEQFRNRIKSQVNSVKQSNHSDRCDAGY